LIDSLLRAWSIHGVSNDLYLDNAKVYHANALKAACYALRINLIHRKAGDPSPGGLVERLFGTNQEQFEAEVRASDILPLDKLNKGFSAWLHTVYHEKVHSETGQPPRKRFFEGKRLIRRIDMDVAIKFFMKCDTRVVNPDFSDVSVDKQFYKVDSKLRGDKVWVRYDPFSTMDRVFIYSKTEEYLGIAPLYQREKEDQEREEKTALAKPKHNFIDLIIARHEKQMQEQARGLDYTKLVNPQRWPFASFVQKLAQLMGKKEGISAFSAQEVKTLEKIYNQNPKLNEPKLTKAFEQAEVKNIAHVAFQLQNGKKE
jgi:hypothetical protein